MVQSFPENKRIPALEFPHFPTRAHAVVWRNRGFVPAARLAGVLRTSEENVRELAESMGLQVPADVDERWLTRGYITIIRANWHLLPYGQLLELLGWDEERMAFTLKEDDFLWIKMGRLKPCVEPVYYRPPTDAERAATLRLRRALEEQGGVSGSGVSGIGAPGSDAFGTDAFGLGAPGIGAEDGFPSSEEPPFAFLHRWDAAPSPAPRRGPPDDDDLVLRTGWRVRYPPHHPRLPRFVERFVRNHEAMWGERLTVDEPAGASCAEPAEEETILLRIDPHPALLPESHRIEAAGRRIVISAVDETGLLRGLQALARDMSRRGGPYVRPGSYRRNTRFDLRLIYSYFAVYGDPLLEPELDPYPDGLLERLSELGVNGIWLQAVLYQLVPWEAAPEWSAGWERRLAGLRRLVERAGDFGIGVYLYYNEPRAMPLSFFADRPDWEGHSDGEHAALCTSREPVRQYLREGTARLVREVPGLAGLVAITMSENLTHCYSRATYGVTACPRCRLRPQQDVVAEVNRLIAEGARSANPDIRILCWTWGWTESFGMKRDAVLHTIDALPEGVTVMSVSETERKTDIAGVEGEIIDYSMSIPGPSETSLECWSRAQARGLATAAKIQVNTTWECSAVPYLPVWDLIEEHMNGLRQSDVTGLMLSWTVGGYPSVNLEFASQYYWESDRGEPAGKDELLRETFGKAAGGKIAAASRLFSRAFREFPFDVEVLYTAPQNYGPANLLYLKPTGYEATMIGFPYDDLKTWRSIYPAARFAGQFNKLSRGWKRGIDRLIRARPDVPDDRRAEFSALWSAAVGAYCHFRSTYLQISFVLHRDRMRRAKSPQVRRRECRKLLDIVEEEKHMAHLLYGLVQRDSSIGYEASNHYYYTAKDLLEKVLNCRHVRGELETLYARAVAEGEQSTER